MNHTPRRAGGSALRLRVEVSILIQVESANELAGKESYRVQHSSERLRWRSRGWQDYMTAYLSGMPHMTRKLH
eukprot:762790-Hanusia_phi.AAC.3